MSDNKSVISGDFDRTGRYEAGLKSLAGSLRTAFMLLLLGIIGTLIYFFSGAGYFSVEPQQSVIVTRFGRIVNIASYSGVAGNRGQVNYSAAKAGLIGATKALALEVARRNITVNAVAPGLIETEMIQDAPIDKILERVPMRRLGRPEEVAALVAFLASEEAGYITGQVLGINGGLG